MAQRATASSEEQGIGGDTLPTSRDSEEEGRNTASKVVDKNIQSKGNPEMAQRATADLEEQRIGGATLPASRDSEEEARNNASEVADKNIGSRRDPAMAPPDLEVSNESNTRLNPHTTQDGPVSRNAL